MRKLALAALAVGVLIGAPAFAQDTRIRVDERGLTIRSGDDDRRDRGPRFREERRGDRWVERRRWRDRDIRTGSVGCRTVIIRNENSRGDTTVRRIRRCD